MQSGHDAHGPVERVPGTREAVQKHEDLGEDTRNLFLVVAGIELLALVLHKKAKVQRLVYGASGIVGIIACSVLYEAAEHGGDLVYNYAGGVGLRSGNPVDIQHLLVAGLYNEARVAREAGRTEEAARLTDELARQMPGDPGVTLMVIESTLRDRKDPAAALAALAAVHAPPENPRLTIQVGLLRSEAYAAAGQPDSARAVLQALAQEYPQSRSVTEALGKMK